MQRLLIQKFFEPSCRKDCCIPLFYSMTVKEEVMNMANINDIMLQASELQPGISRLLRNSTYPRYDDLSGLEINYEDGEQLFLLG